MGQAKRILLAGFDGYDAADKRQQEMITLLQLIQESNHTVEMIAVTPTTYPISKGSVYAML